MSTMLSPDTNAPPSEHDLARIVEWAEARMWTDMVRAAPSEMTEALGLRAVPFGRGMALVTANVPSVLYSRAFGFGLEEPLDEATLDRMIALFRRDAPFSIQPCPQAQPEAIRGWLEARGLVAHFDWVRWVRDASAVSETATDLTIERIGRAEARTFVELAFTIFSDPKPIGPWLDVTVGREGWSHYFALDRGAPVGVGTLYVEDGVGWLGWGGTLETHRRRGAQSALIARRLRDGVAQGCRWFTVETADDLPEKPNPSFRNMERAGFRLLFRRPSHAWFPPDAEPAPEIG